MKLYKLHCFLFSFFLNIVRRGKKEVRSIVSLGIPSLIGIHRTDRDIITITIFNRIINRRTILYVRNSGNNRRYTSLRGS